MTVSELGRPPLMEDAEPADEVLPSSSAPPRQGSRPALMRRVLRYLGTSIASTIASEVTLLLLFGLHLTTAAVAAVLATALGGLLSYGLSRYWIWADADRSHAARQMTLYWVITLAGLLASTFVTSETAAHTVGAGTLRTALVGAVYLATYLVLWVVKFGLYHKLLFRPRREPGPVQVG